MSFIRPRDLKVPLALLLDVDGTLLEIAPTPEAVTVPACVRTTLQAAFARQQGALALVSGRTIGDLDRLFTPEVFPAAGQHGLERRDSSGRIHLVSVEPRLLDPARRALRDLQRSWKGTILEDKGTALALHYRLAEDAEESVKETMAELCRQLDDKFVLRPGKCVLELAPGGISKRTAVEAFMREPPFQGRVPVFIGDDVTDEDGFAAVNALGGYSIRVGASDSTVAKYHLGNVTDVIAWLGEC